MLGRSHAAPRSERAKRQLEGTPLARESGGELPASLDVNAQGSASVVGPCRGLARLRRQAIGSVGSGRPATGDRPDRGVPEQLSGLRDARIARAVIRQMRTFRTAAI
jgi:hypothetical protein